MHIEREDREKGTDNRPVIKSPYLNAVMMKLFAGSQSIGGVVLIGGQKLALKLAGHTRKNGRVVRDAAIVSQALESAVHCIKYFNGFYHSHIKDGVAMFHKVGVSVFRISVQSLLLVGVGFHSEYRNENDAKKWSNRTLHGSHKLNSNNTLSLS